MVCGGQARKSWRANGGDRQYGIMVWYGMVRYCMRHNGMVWHNKLPWYCTMVWYHGVVPWYGMIWYGIVPCYGTMVWMADSDKLRLPTLPLPALMTTLHALSYNMIWWKTNKQRNTHIRTEARTSRNVRTLHPVINVCVDLFSLFVLFMWDE